MGTLAKRMEPADPKVSQVLDRLLEALQTPSEVVQRTVALSLAELFSGDSLKRRAEQYVSPLLSTLLQTASYAERRGAAFGLAGVCKGVGLTSLKRYGVMLALARALDEKKRGEAEANAREGALNAYECLCEAFGRLFEPYATPPLPPPYPTLPHPTPPYPTLPHATPPYPTPPTPPYPTPPYPTPPRPTLPRPTLPHPTPTHPR